MKRASKTQSGGDINYNSIQRMLNNRRYIGEYAFRDIVVPDGIPAIVPKELFDRVQAKLAKNKKSPARHKAEEDYLLTTKLFCGCCGAYMCGESGKGRSGEMFIAITNAYPSKNDVQSATKNRFARIGLKISS